MLWVYGHYTCVTLSVRGPTLSVMIRRLALKGLKLLIYEKYNVYLFSQIEK